MKPHRTIEFTLVLIMATSGFAQAQNRNHSYQEKEKNRAIEACSVRSECGRITSIDKEQQIAKSSGVGTAVGAVGGAYLGKRMSDSTLGMVAGGVAGAAVGNYAQRKIQADDIYLVNIKYKSGKTTQLKIKDVSAYSVGQEVRVQNNKVIWTNPTQ